VNSSPNGGFDLMGGWVERSEPHPLKLPRKMVGLAPLDPPYIFLRPRGNVSSRRSGIKPNASNDLGDPGGPSAAWLVVVAGDILWRGASHTPTIRYDRGYKEPLLEWVLAPYSEPSQIYGGYRILLLRGLPPE
jgi:hypothetical protein